MSGNILVHGHMRFADEDDDSCKVYDEDYFHRFSNKTYATNMHNNRTPLEIATNTSIIYKDMIGLFRSMPPQQMTAPALYANVNMYNHLKLEMAAALEELTILGQVCGISLKDIMKEKLR